jgi:Big-like domain-containing protein
VNDRSLISSPTEFLPLIPLAAVALAACGGGGLVLPAEGAAANIAIVRGDGQGAAVGAVLPESLVVRITDSNGRPVQSQAVTFAVTAGGGSVAPASATTGSDGLAATRWVLGPTAGPQRATATATGSGAPPNVSISFTATAGIASTSIGVTSGKNPSDAGEAVQFTATVGWPAGAGTPTGTVSFRDGSTTFATVPLQASGTVSASTTFASAGQHPITAQYFGDANFGGSTSATLAQEVRVVDRPPMAVSDAYAVNEDALLNVGAPGVLGNDSDPDGNPITAAKVGDPAHGTVALNADGSFTYTPAANYYGPDAFTYQASDGTLRSGTATVSIAVNPVNDPPSFTAGPDQTASGGSGEINVTGWATNISPGPANENTQTVTFTVTNDNPSAFAFGQQPAVDSNGTLTFQPAFLVLSTMTANVTVVAHDDGGTANGGQDTSASQTFTITITP